LFSKNLFIWQNIEVIMNLHQVQIGFPKDLTSHDLHCPKNPVESQ